MRFAAAPPHAKLLAMAVAIARPKLEGNIAVGED
ncbi:alpha/beta hydrolase, partial [Mycobacterium tuberculosis]|nr:alpha/beta hydrolase [Mycobacterium tuberculosis]